jgi:O-acetyl-ADP-ribose deacetylase (regulator of RNase III)
VLFYPNLFQEGAMEKQFNQLIIELFKGDITALEVDGIVNAANNHLWMGAGVAGAIKRKGGAIIEKEAVAQGPIPVGEAVVTTAGSLPAHYVIHAAGMGQDLHTDVEKISLSTKNSLKRAAEKGMVSVAFPAIGTGVGGFSAEECARIMIDEAIKHSEEKSSVRKVIFALFDEGTYNSFKKVLSEYS